MFIINRVHEIQIYERRNFLRADLYGVWSSRICPNALNVNLLDMLCDENF